MVLKMAELYSFSVVGIKITKRVTTLWQLWGTCSTSFKLLVLLCFPGNLCEIPVSLHHLMISFFSKHIPLCVATFRDHLNNLRASPINSILKGALSINSRVYRKSMGMSLMISPIDQPTCKQTHSWNGFLNFWFEALFL